MRLIQEWGGIPSIIKEPLLVKIWSPDYSKKHSIHPITSYMFVDAFGLAVNMSVRLLQLLV